jgi:hypothetical protein
MDAINRGAAIAANRERQAERERDILPPRPMDDI